jgi:hypothetical protein
MNAIMRIVRSCAASKTIFSLIYSKLKLIDKFQDIVSPYLRITGVPTQNAMDHLFHTSIELHRHTNLSGDNDFI